MSTITLDQLIIASKASGISLADLIVSIDNANAAATPARSTAQVTPAPKAVKVVKRNASKDAIMAVKQASQGQMNRINERHIERNLRPYRTLAEFRMVYPTMLDASIYNAEFSA